MLNVAKIEEMLKTPEMEQLEKDYAEHINRLHESCSKHGSYRLLETDQLATRHVPSKNRAKTYPCKGCWEVKDQRILNRFYERQAAGELTKPEKYNWYIVRLNFRNVPISEKKMAEVK